MKINFELFKISQFKTTGDDFNKKLEDVFKHTTTKNKNKKKKNISNANLA